MVWNETYKLLIRLYLAHSMINVSQLCETAWTAIKLMAEEYPLELPETDPMFIPHETTVLGRMRIIA